VAREVKFGDYLRGLRETRAAQDAAFGLRRIAEAVGMAPGYLSRIERNELPPPSDDVLRKLADVLDEPPEVLFAMAGRVAPELQAIILRRPKAFAELLRELKDAPEKAILRVVREVRDGDWT
jgi:transcriptional regulator with XRE-family HTH domain